MPAQALSLKHALAIAFTVIAGSLSAPSHAEQLPVTIDTAGIFRMPPEVLERAFWVCDHTATVHGVDATPVAECTTVFEAIKHTKFGGDFIELLAWWRANKAIEHTKLERQ